MWKRVLRFCFLVEMATASEQTSKMQEDPVENKTEEMEEPQEKPNGEGMEDTNGEEEEPQALFDQPLIQEGKRKRRSTDMFSFGVEEKLKKSMEYSGGSGVKLGDIPIVEYHINKNKADDLRVLHKLCFERTGNKLEIKRNLKGFNGFPDDIDQLKRKRLSLEKMTVPGLGLLCELLDLGKSKSKEKIIDSIMDFLNNPVDSGKDIPRKRKSSSGGVKKPRKKSKPSESEDKESDEKDEEKKENNKDNEMETETNSVIKDDKEGKEAAEAEETEEVGEKEKDKTEEGEEKKDLLETVKIGEEHQETKEENKETAEKKEEKLEADETIEKKESNVESQQPVINIGTSEKQEE